MIKIKFTLKFPVFLLIALMVPVANHAQDLQKILELGISYLDSGKYEESRNALNEFLKYDSSSAKAWNCIGITFLLQEDPDSAIYYFNRSLDADSAYLNATFNMGRAYAQLMQYPEARNCFNSYAKRHPDTSAVWIDIARSFEDQGIYDSALYFINIAIKKDPGSLDAIGQRMFLNMVMEQYESCVDDARHILTVIPDDLTAIYCLALGLMESGDYEGSIRHIQQGIELEPRLAAFYALMSRGLTRQGSFMESGMFINRAIDLAPHETGHYFIKAENAILSITDPGIILANIYPPRFKSIKSQAIRGLDKYISDRKHKYYYKTLTDRFSKDFRSLALDDYFMLYWSRSISDLYAPYSHPEQHIIESMSSMMDTGKYAEAAMMGADYLEKNPSEISIYHYTGLAYLNSGNYNKAEEYFHKYQGFITSILATGDGKGPGSAYIVISTREEYTLMNYLGLRISGQVLTEQNGHYFDILTGIAPSGEEKQVYFNIDKPYGSLKRLYR